MIVTVLGMQHSGTSCLAECLMRAGLSFGTELRGWTHEDRRISRLHSIICGWHEPRLRVTESAREERDRIIVGFGSGSWGWKCPITIFTLPFWQEAIDVRLVGTFRHPRHVTGYLRSQFSYSAEEADALWCRYNQELLSIHDDTPFPLVAFDWEPDQYGRAVSSIVEDLGLDSSKPLFDMAKRTFKYLRPFEPSPKAARIYAMLEHRAFYGGKTGETGESISAPAET